MKERDTGEKVYACPHLEKLKDDLASGLVPSEREEGILNALGLHGIEHPDGTILMLCNRCYAKGRSDILRMKWVIGLKDFKDRHGE